MARRDRSGVVRLGEEGRAFVDAALQAAGELGRTVPRGAWADPCVFAVLPLERKLGANGLEHSIGMQARQGTDLLSRVLRAFGDGLAATVIAHSQMLSVDGIADTEEAFILGAEVYEYAESPHVAELVSLVDVGWRWTFVATEVRADTLPRGGAEISPRALAEAIEGANLVGVRAFDAEGFVYLAPESHVRRIAAVLDA